MEPGFLKPGNAPDGSLGCPLWPDFNGARLPEARKRANSENACASRAADFNGARLPEARKLAAASDAVRGDRGDFNGARLPEARKHYRWQPKDEPTLATSMEPGFLKPGNKVSLKRVTGVPGDFNGARLPEARKLGEQQRLANANNRLQWSQAS